MYCYVIKVKLFVVQGMKAYERVEVQLCTFLTVLLEAPVQSSYPEFPSNCCPKICVLWLYCA
jgi:hypothetical protein